MKSTAEPSLKRNLFLNIIYEILLIGTTLITTPYVSRVLQADGVGINSYTTSLLTYFTLFAVLGTQNYGKKVIAGLRYNIELYSRAFWEIELISVITTSISLICWILFALSYNQYRPYMLVLSFTLLSALFDISWLYGGLEKYQYIVIVNSVCKAISVGCIFLFVKNKDDVLMYTAINSISMLCGTVLMWVFLPKQITKTRINAQSIKMHFRETLVYFGPTIATSIYTVLDKTLIGIITGSNSENGYYEQATKIIDLVKSGCFNTINGVMISRASFLHSRNNQKELMEIRDVSYHIICLLSIGVCFGLIGVSNVLVPIFFGDGYTPVIYLIDILAVVVVIIGISSVANSIYYIAGGYMKKATKLILYGSFVNLILNIVLIPSMESYGAAIATLIAECLITFLFVKGTDGFITFKYVFNLIWKKAFSGGIMLLGIMSLNSIIKYIDRFQLLVLEIVSGIVLYFFVLVVLKDSSVLICINNVKLLLIKGKEKNE